uniref:Uncharacterized protein n=1 Tax=Arion vulgaris TaxID=1028688 RepID=A0A0B6ZIJ8_9EUPU
MNLAEMTDTDFDDSHPALPVLVMVEVGAVLTLILVLVTCMCCYRQENKRYGKYSSGRDTTHLDDLLSKPSLADPESVFSEAGSFAYRYSTHGRSFHSMSDERSISPVDELTCLPVSSCDLNISNTTNILNQTTDEEALDAKEEEGQT